MRDAALTVSINRATVCGLKYIRAQQQANGGFISQSSPRQTPWQPAYHYRTVFVPALMLASLAGQTSRAALEIRQKLAGFLLTQKGPHWSFNYWAKRTPERRTMPYPDDLDDTFCALIGLHLHDPSLVGESALAQVVKLLVATETAVGGPYRTWLVAPKADPKDVWQDIDLAVNANIAYFIASVGSRLPQLDALFQTAIRQQQYRSPYYPSAYPIWYYLARASSVQMRPALRQTIKQAWRQNKQPTPLETALVLTSLCRLGAPAGQPQRLAKQLLAAQLPDGSWPAAAFCIDPARQQRHHYHGSSALTTAFALEALERYRQSNQAEATAPARKPAAKADPRAGRLQQRILTQASRQADQLQPDLRRQLNTFLQRVVKGDTKHEITLLPYLFTRSLARPAKLPDSLFINFGLANLYGWVAYTIYDDFLDDEGDPRLLSAANVALRNSVLSFQRALPGKTAFQKLVEQTFNTIDNANTWEVTHCRFAVDGQSIKIGALPRYGGRQKLAERSLGHGLTPLGILVARGASLNSPGVQAIEQAFRHYLIARQLNDDAHDWKEDVQKGHITYVVVCILQEMGLSGQQSFADLLPTMERQFWHHTLPRVCRDIQRHIARARRLLAKNSYLYPVNALTVLLDGIEASTQEAIDSQRQTVQFLQSYRGQKTNS